MAQKHMKCMICTMHSCKNFDSIHLEIVKKIIITREILISTLPIFIALQKGVYFLIFPAIRNLIIMHHQIPTSPPLGSAGTAFFGNPSGNFKGALFFGWVWGTFQWEALIGPTVCRPPWRVRLQESRQKFKKASTKIHIWYSQKLNPIHSNSLS